MRVTLTTADPPYLEPSAAQLPNLAGGVYEVHRSAPAASYINLPLVAASAFSTPCGALCAYARLMGANDRARCFSPTEGKLTRASALAPSPQTDRTTPSPHLAWTTVSPARRPS